MGRKITMTGKNAKYIEHRAADATPDNDRDIRLEGVCLWTGFTTQT